MKVQQYVIFLLWIISKLSYAVLDYYDYSFFPPNCSFLNTVGASRSLQQWFLYILRVLCIFERHLRTPFLATFSSVWKT